MVATVTQIEGALIAELLQGLTDKDREFVASTAENLAASLISAVGKARGSSKEISLHDFSLCSTIARIASHGLNATYKAHLT